MTPENEHKESCITSPKKSALSIVMKLVARNTRIDLESGIPTLFMHTKEGREVYDKNVLELFIASLSARNTGATPKEIASSKAYGVIIGIATVRN